MEVEPRISVQAMRGIFEQKPGDTSNLSTPFPLSKPNTSPVRTRTSSLIINDNISRSEKTPNGKSINSVEKKKCLNENATQSSNSVSKTRSIFADIVSPMLLGSKVSKALSPKKHSLDSVENKKIITKTNEVTDRSSIETPVRKVSDSNSETKPSVVRRIPVFKPHSEVICSDDKTNGKKDIPDSPKETCSRKDRFLRHIRSRSHGNFMIKRDPSTERGDSSSNNVSNLHTAENENTELFSKRLEQKSSENLYGHRDSKCVSPFEGKQKIVANVVKNMKNKDKPKVLRKFSFSSKIEKDIKNIKERSSPNKENDTQVVQPSHTSAHGTAQMAALAKSTVKERRSSFAGSPTIISVAKAVADIALVKNSARSSESSSCTLNPSEEGSPPPRPPRRRSTTTNALLSHKKGMAPSPPGPLLPPNISKNYDTSPLSPEKHSRSALQLDQVLDPDNNNSSSSYKSSDSLNSPQSTDISRDNSPELISQSFSKINKQISKSSIDIQEADKFLSEGYCTCDDEQESKTEFDNSKTIMRIQSGGTKQTDEPEFLPAGPPPKKPPRTFAYDIYRSCKESKNENDQSKKDNKETHDNSQLKTPSSEPVYAKPVKKKKPEKVPTPKPPRRSKSDLTHRDLIKPSITPKPAHILNKVKDRSAVEHLSRTEKDEEEPISSEFQQQAHIRYSLRRPKKPPPAPPTNSSGGTALVNKMKVSKALAKSHPGINQHFSNSDSDHGSGSSPQLVTDRCSPTDSLDVTITSRNTTESIYQSVNSDDDTDNSDVNTSSFRITSRSSYNLSDNQPLSLGHFPVIGSEGELEGLYRKKSMSDETLYMGHKHRDEPIYAMPIFTNGRDSRGHNRKNDQLHYMCSVLFTEEEAEGGQDGGISKDGMEESNLKGRIMSAWKREFRRSCRQVQNRIKKTVKR